MGEISPRAGLELGTARSVGQRLTHLATGAPRDKKESKYNGKYEMSPNSILLYRRVL